MEDVRERVLGCQLGTGGKYPLDPGKIIFPNNGVVDGVVCWADGFDINPNDTYDDKLYDVKFTPFLLKFKFGDIAPEDVKVIFRYEDSDPADVTFKLRPEPHPTNSSKYEYFAPEEGESRIWTKHGDEVRKKESIVDNGCLLYTSPSPRD